MIDGLGFCVIYRARVAPDKKQQYVAAWSKITRLLGSERGALGSRLHRVTTDFGTRTRNGPVQRRVVRLSALGRWMPRLKLT